VDNAIVECTTCLVDMNSNISNSKFNQAGDTSHFPHPFIFSPILSIDIPISYILFNNHTNIELYNLTPFLSIA